VRLGKPMVRMGKEISELPEGENFPCWKGSIYVLTVLRNGSIGEQEEKVNYKDLWPTC
jgi:hypothetical protein